MYVIFHPRLLSSRMKYYEMINDSEWCQNSLLDFASDIPSGRDSLWWNFVGNVRPTRLM